MRAHRFGEFAHPGSIVDDAQPRIGRRLLPGEFSYLKS